MQLKTKKIVAREVHILFLLIMITGAAYLASGVVTSSQV